MDIPLAQPALTEEMIAESTRVLEEEYFLRGDSVKEFEAEFAEYIGVEHAISLDSGTRAIRFCLEALGIGDGDTVLTTPGTFVSTAAPILQIGAEIEFVDIDLETYTLDLNATEQVVSEKEVDAILPVHLYGHPVDVPELKSIAPDTPVISDACQAHGATRNAERVGSFSDMAAFSFYPSKNMTVGGDGGMIVTDDPELARTARTLRDVGRDPETGEHVVLGYTARLDSSNAAIGRKQLERLDEWNERRREIARTYDTGLSGIDGLSLPPAETDDVKPAWYMYTVRTDQRDELQEHLSEREIETGINYEKPVHRQPSFRGRGYDDTSFPAAEQWADEILCLPSHPKMGDEEVDRVVKSVREFFEAR